MTTEHHGTVRAVLEGLHCRCGAELTIAEDTHGNPAVVHGMPICDGFRADRPLADFLKWVRTGKL